MKKKIKKAIKTLYYYLLCQVLNPTSHGVNPYEGSRLKYFLTKNVPRNNTSAILLSIGLQTNEGNYASWLVRRARINEVAISIISNRKDKVVVLLIGEAVELERMVDIAWKGKSKTRVKDIREKWFNKKIILNNDSNEGDNAEISWSHSISNSIKFNLGNVRDILNNPNAFSDTVSEKGSDEIEKAVQANGLFTAKFLNNIYVTSPGIKTGFTFAESANISANKREITNNKVVTKDILLSAGVPAPQGIIAENFSKAKKYLASLNKSIVVKPLEGSQGKGVSVDIQNESQLKIAWDYAKGFHEKIILEEMVSGTDIRILVFGGKALVAQMRVPAHIIGDGKNTVEHLIEGKNNLRLKNPRLDKSLIKINAYSYEYLKRQNHSLTSIPKDGEIVFLHLKANLSAGGDNIIVTEKINPDLMRLAEEAASALNMNDYLGVDLLVEDMLLTRHQQDCKIVEVNSRAALRGVQYPLYGIPFNAPNELIKKTIIEKDNIKEFGVKKVYIETTGHFDLSLKNWISEQVITKNITEDIAIGDGKGSGALYGKEDDLYNFLAELMEWKSAENNMYVDGVTIVEDKLKTKKDLDSNKDNKFLSNLSANTYNSDLNNEYKSNMELVLEELNNNGYKAERITNELISIQKGENTGITGINPNSEFAYNVCSKIYPAKKILTLNGLPVPRGIRASCNRRQISQRFLDMFQNTAIATFEYPEGSPTYRLESDITLNSLCKKAIKKGGRYFIIEEEPRGIHVCIAVVANQPLSALAIESPHIVGDGKNSIESLIDNKNKHRDQNPWYANKEFEIDDELIQYIKSSGYGINDIPTKGEKVPIGESRYWNIDGDTININEILHEDFKRQAVRAVAAIPGLKLAYVHMVVENPTLVKDDQSWKITRIDSRPELLAFHYPWKGKPYNLAKDVALKLCAEDEVLWKKDKRQFNMAIMGELISKVKEYHDNNENQYPLQKRFHYNSRMYLHTKSQRYLDVLNSLKEDWGKSPEWFLENAEAIPKTEYIEKKLDPEKQYRIEARSKHHKIYPYNRLFFKALFQEQIYNEEINLKEIINLEDINEVRTNLVNDEKSLLTLSTPAVNFLYNYNYFIRGEELDPEFLLRIGDIELEDDILSQYHAKIYFYTHAIIGASRFYTKPIELHEDKYLKMLDKIEDLAIKNFDMVSMDQKFEMLVCANLLNKEISIKDNIIDEAIQSLSTEGDYFVDRFNKYNNEKNKKTTFNKSEHRNVLAIMAFYDKSIT